MIYLTLFETFNKLQCVNRFTMAFNLTGFSYILQGIRFKITITDFEVLFTSGF